MASKNISLEPPSVAFTGEARYLTPLWVSRTGCELSKSATTEGFEPRAHDQTIHDKIKAALKLLALRKPHVLVQFWSPRVVGKQHQLTTKDQPFGLGVCDDQRLISYRRNSECKNHDVDKDYDEEEDKQDLTCLQASGGPAPNIDHEGKQNEMNKIFGILKVVCDTHRLPLAQTWALTPSASVVSHEQVLTKSCNHYDTRCLGKVCMSTVSLPFRVQDMRLWPFRDACKAQHLDMSRGLVGKALSSRGSCFCEDVTKLSEEEYPLVSYASMSGLTSCFATYLHSLGTNDGYVLEFFLPSRLEDSRYMLKQQVIEIYYGVDLDDKLPIQVIGPQINTYVTREPYIMQTSSVIVSDECSSTNTNVTFNDAGEMSSHLKQNRKRKRGSDDTMVLVTVTYGEDIKSFRFPISLGLLKLKNEVTKRFKLMGKMICLKYTDEDNDKIRICVDKDLEDAMVASGSKNSMNLICKPSAD
nr:hypothetical protein [Tanacetum cinerariifolium]